MRNIRDALLRSTTALPAQNTNNNTAGINLGTVAPEVTLEHCHLLFSVPAAPVLANAQTLTFKFQDSADGVTYADIPELATLVMTGGGGVGAPAASRRVNLPPACRAWVRVNQAASATAADNTAVSSVLELLT